VIFSTSFIFFQIGKKFCSNEKKIEYRFIPRTQEELESHITAVDVIKDYA
jgi:hypothetical protein